MTKTAVRNVAGISLLVAGGIGCLLPVIPGIPLLLLGAATLGKDHPIVRGGRGWLKSKGWWPKHFDERKAPESQPDPTGPPVTKS